jgi:hypothetical protein
MSAPNPYAPPQAGQSPNIAAPMQVIPGGEYVPLGWRTVLAALSILGMTFLDLVMRVCQLAFGDALTASARGGTPDLGAALIIGAAGLGVLVTSVSAWVFFFVWIYRAAANLPGLGRYGMTFSPGGCIGWYFVPFANLWKPPQAMSEIWRASDPAADQGSWISSAGTPLIAAWWASWLISGVVSWGSVMAKDDASAAAGIGLVSIAFRAVAAVTLVLLMRGVQARQEQAAARLGR